MIEHMNAREILNTNPKEFFNQPSYIAQEKAMTYEERLAWLKELRSEVLNLDNARKVKALTMTKEAFAELTTKQHWMAIEAQRLEKKIRAEMKRRMKL